MQSDAFVDEASRRWFSALGYLYRACDRVTYSFVNNRLKFSILDDGSLTAHKVITHLTKQMMPGFWWYKADDMFCIEVDPMAVVLDLVDIKTRGMRKSSTPEKSPLQGNDGSGDQSLFDSVF